MSDNGEHQEMRSLASREPLQFVAACLERALAEQEGGGDWLASIVSDLSKWRGARADLHRAVDLYQWGALLEQGRAAVQARATELGMGTLR